VGYDPDSAANHYEAGHELGLGVMCVHNGQMDDKTWAQSWICDMDGVLIAEGSMVDGADRFLERLRSTGRTFLILTNNSLFTPRQICDQLSSMGLEVAEQQLWTSALATARFVHTQRPGGSAFVIGEDSLHNALRDVGYREDSQQPDYVVLGETQDYSFDDFATAIRLIETGSHFVATNSEPTGPSANGSLPGCGAMAALIERATGVAPYYVGKPNSVMIREALNVLGAHADTAVMIGDRMDTDVLAGIEAGLETILVLSGVSGEGDVDGFPYRPSRVVGSIADLIDEL
jgi:NagD protein